MSRHIIRLVAATVIVTSAAASAPACGFIQMARPTLRQDAVQAKFICVCRAEPLPDNHATDYVVCEIIKDHAGIKGRKVLRNLGVPKLEDRAKCFLVYGDIYKGEPDLFMLRPASPELVKYVRDLLAIDVKDGPGLMRYSFDYLEHADKDVAEDAVQNFMQFPDPEIRAFARKLKPEKLRQWVANEKTAVDRVRLYGYMLGNCGTADDAKLLCCVLKRMCEKKEPPWQADGVMTGYTILDPKAGWTFVKCLAADGRAEFTARYGALRTARYFHTTPHPEIVSEKDVLAVVTALLAHGDIADMAIEDLRKWRCWDFTHTILALDGKPGFSDPQNRRSILRYALQCPGARAAEHVAAKRKADAAWVDDVKELLELETSTPKGTP